MYLDGRQPSIVRAINCPRTYAVGCFDVLQALINNSLLGYVANKIYSSKVISNIRFKEIPYREDLIFNLQALKKCNCMYLSDICGYNYRQRNESTLHNQYYGNVPDIRMAVSEILEIHPTLTKKQNRRLVNRLLKVYLTDIITKCIIQNATLDEYGQYQAVRRIFDIRSVRESLRLYKKDCALHKVFTICYRLHLPVVFLKLYRRQYDRE